MSRSKKMQYGSGIERNIPLVGYRIERDPSKHRYWLERMNKDSILKLRSIQSGVNLGFVNEMSLNDCEGWALSKDI